MLIKLHYYNKRDYGVQNLETKEIIINTNFIHKAEKGSFLCNEDRRYYSCTELYLDEYVAKWETKKKYLVAESLDYILQKIEEGNHD